MGRLIAFVYGLASYIVFLIAFLYAIVFTGNLYVDKTIDSGEPGALGRSLLINALLLALFAIQHTIMARPGFKRSWTAIVPRVVERSTFVLFASLILILLYWQWQPMPEEVWNVAGTTLGTVLWVLFWAGWGLVLLATFMLNHFELFGLQQVYLNVVQRDPQAAAFKTPGLYRYVRHPIMLGFIIAFWSTPTMSQGHLLFAVMTMGYIMVGVTLEERDLIAHFGEEYRDYKRQVRALIPIRKKG